MAGAFCYMCWRGGNPKPPLSGSLTFVTYGYALQTIIERAKAACKVSGYAISDHFADVRKIVKAGVATKRIADVHLSRYACCLIAMNGDPRKEAMALTQTYFAVKTRQQELAEHYDELTEDLPTPDKSIK